MKPIPQQAMDYFRGVSPWDELPPELLQEFVATTQLVYLTTDNEELIEQQIQQGNSLLLVQSGDFEVCERMAKTTANLRFISDNEYVFMAVNQWQYPPEKILKIHAPGLVYCLNLKAVEALQLSHKAVQQFFASYVATLTDNGLNFGDAPWQEDSLTSLCERQPVTVAPDCTIQECAKMMTRLGISSVLVTEQHASHSLLGIITDKDLRNKVVATGTSGQEPVAGIMTSDPLTANIQQDWLDAVCLMSENRISHVPILDAEGLPVGIMTKSDIVNRQRSDIAWLIKSLAKANNLYELMQQAWQIPHYIRFNMQGKQGFASIGEWLSRATDVMTRKLIGFYVQQHGQAPMDYSWLVYGSQARKDQLLTSDQDNGLLLAREPDEKENQYFAAFSEYVCQGLAKCGIKLCAGNIMASNPEMRKSLEAAKAQARQCVTEPTTDRLLHFNIFLDVRRVAGSEALFEALQSSRATLFKTPLFLAALAREINQCTVPLNLFQRFVYESGKGRKINLKVNAVAVLNDLVRLYAQAEGIQVAGTSSRLKALAGRGVLSVKDVNNLMGIWTFLNELRLQSQLNQKQPDNLVTIDTLMPLEKYQLKKAFQSLKRAQSAILVKFSGGMAG